MEKGAVMTEEQIARLQERGDISIRVETYYASTVATIRCDPDMTRLTVSFSELEIDQAKTVEADFSDADAREHIAVMALNDISNSLHGETHEMLSGSFH